MDEEHEPIPVLPDVMYVVATGGGDWCADPDGCDVLQGKTKPQLRGRYVLTEQALYTVGEHAILCGEIHTPPESPPQMPLRPDGYLIAYFALVAEYVRDVGHCPMLVAICKVGYEPYCTVEGAQAGIRNAIERGEPALGGIVWCRNRHSETEFLGVAQPQ